jgi:hypothetical protein
MAIVLPPDPSLAQAEKITRSRARRDASEALQLPRPALYEESMAPTTPMKKFDGFDLVESLDFRFLHSASPSDIETACKYEYMRESQALRDALAKGEKKGPVLPSRFLPVLTFPQLGRLMLALQKAGFPTPWKRLAKVSRKRLVSLLAQSREETMRGDKAAEIPPIYPPLVIETVHFDSLAKDHELPYHWPSEPSEPSLFQTWERSGRKYFFGFIRIDEDYNETEAVAAFRAWFRAHYAKTKGGGGPKWRNRLKQLAVMRIWKHERNQWKRLQLVAKFCRYKGCVKEAAAYKERCKQEGHGDEPMSDAAKVEMSSARAEAREFFQRLFSGCEKPLSYQGFSRREKS